MAELVWSLNGKYFKDFGVGISSSDGILGELKPKKQDTKDWSEYNGVALDLTKKPKYEAREFTLSGWIVGSDWLTMLNNFNTLFGEFRNAGQQRLLLDVFGQKTLVFDVRCDDEIELKKTFKEGKMVGMFNLKLTEHNPIKKILYTAKSNLQLSFNTPKWVEVNIDGKIDVYKGTVNINKTLTNRVVTRYNFEGRNLLLNTSIIDGINVGGATPVKYGLVVNNNFGKHIIKDTGTESYYRYMAPDSTKLYGLKPGKYSYSCEVLNSGTTDNTAHVVIRVGLYKSGWTEKLSSKTYIVDAANWVKINHTFTIDSDVTGVWVSFQVYSSANFDFLIKNEKLELGTATVYKVAPEDQHFISIAGNIDEITALTTNADVLWEKL